jgi:outer membrane protein assembly factor BamA
MMRFNRVEGFSNGVQADQQLGEGLSAGGTFRFGLADRDPNIELTAARSNLRTTVRLTGYHRLVSASDWGNPLSFGSSFSSLFFGKEEGFYYRATGADLTWSRGETSRAEWRLFADNEKTAKVQTGFSFAHGITNDTFPSNIVATEGNFFGGGLHLVHNHGVDPRGFRTFSDLRLEAAKGDSLYGRAAGELTMSEGTPFNTAVGITLSAGSSVGFLPVQREWYLGGSQTVRGQSVSVAQSGNAFWLTRLELGHDNPGHRTSIFGDLGWVGDRTRMSAVGRPMSGVGYGESIFDGILRFDVARGLYPRQQWKFDFYLEARF